MNEEYIFNVVRRISTERTPDKAEFVRYGALLEAIQEDVKLALNSLVSQKKLAFSRTVNGELLFKENGRVD